MDDQDQPPPRPFRLGTWFWFWLAFGLICVIVGALTAHYGPRLSPPTAKPASQAPQT